LDILDFFFRFSWFSPMAAKVGASRVKFMFDDCCLDTDRRELRRGTRPVAVEPQVFDILELLVRNRDRMVSNDDLIAAIWKGRIVSDSALNSRMTAVRQAIGDSGQRQGLIRTIPRKGYRFVAAVKEEPIGSRRRGSHCGRGTSERVAGRNKTVREVLSNQGWDQSRGCIIWERSGAGASRTLGHACRA
jgi:DNA-binding winged helix-turn-helix (wHTH) protein